MCVNRTMTSATAQPLWAAVLWLHPLDNPLQACILHISLGSPTKPTPEKGPLWEMGMHLCTATLVNHPSSCNLLPRLKCRERHHSTCICRELSWAILSALRVHSIKMQ